MKSNIEWNVTLNEMQRWMKSNIEWNATFQEINIERNVTVKEM